MTEPYLINSICCAVIQIYVRLPYLLIALGKVSTLKIKVLKYAFDIITCFSPQMYTGACCLTYLMWFDTKPDSMFSVNEYLLWGFPCGSAGQESAYNVGDPGSIPGLGRSPGEGKG